MENRIVIGKIVIPKNAIPDFSKQLKISKDLLQKVDGFIRQDFFEHYNDSGDLTVVGATTWENEQAFKAGMLATQEEYKRINFNQAEYYQRFHIKAERVVYIKSKTIIGSARPNVESKGVIDSFFVPKNAVDEFKKRALDSIELLHNLNGFIQTDFFEHLDEAGNLVALTITTWDSQASIEVAKKSMIDKSAESGFNPAEFYERTGITIDRGIYSIANN